MIVAKRRVIEICFVGLERVKISRSCEGMEEKVQSFLTKHRNNDTTVNPRSQRRKSAY